MIERASDVHLMFCLNHCLKGIREALTQLYQMRQERSFGAAMILPESIQELFSSRSDWMEYRKIWGKNKSRAEGKHRPHSLPLGRLYDLSYLLSLKAAFTAWRVSGLISTSK
jgi:hypothetical protein